MHHQNFLNEPVRKGFGKPHNLFISRLSLSSSTKSLNFFEYGCSACYISSSLAHKLFPYKSISSTISGISGEGPMITKDVLIHAQFLTCDNKWSSKFVASAGILPDGTFLGDLTLGLTMFHSYKPISFSNLAQAQKLWYIFSIIETGNNWHKINN